LLFARFAVLARTVNAAAHRVRREAFLDAAEHLIRTRG